MPAAPALRPLSLRLCGLGGRTVSVLCAELWRFTMTISNGDKAVPSQNVVESRFNVHLSSIDQIAGPARLFTDRARLYVGRVSAARKGVGTCHFGIIR